MMLVAEALETEQAHGLPSSVIRIHVTEGDKSVFSDGREIMSTLPVSALITRTPDGGFAALLPFTSAEGAGTIAKAIGQRHPSLRTSNHLIVGPAPLEELWTRILAV